MEYKIQLRNPVTKEKNNSHSLYRRNGIEYDRTIYQGRLES